MQLSSNFVSLITAPPLVLNDTMKTNSSDDGNWTLSIEFISLHYQPEVHWFRTTEDKAAESLGSTALGRMFYEITKDNIIYDIPSYQYVIIRFNV
jgi:hypothetical protein